MGNVLLSLQEYNELYNENIVLSKLHDELTEELEGVKLKYEDSLKYLSTRISDLEEIIMDFEFLDYFFGVYGRENIYPFKENYPFLNDSYTLKNIKKSEISKFIDKKFDEFKLKKEALEQEESEES